MKKFLALLLAAMMLLASVSALAEEVSSSITTEDTTEANTNFFVPAAPGTVAQDYKGQIEGGTSILDLIEDPGMKQQVIDKLGEDVTVKDLVSLSLTDWTAEDGAQVVEFEFSTEYKAGEPVVALLVLVTGETKEQFILDAEVVEDYVVSVKFPVEILEKATKADEMFVMIISAADAPADAVVVTDEEIKDEQ